MRNLTEQKKKKLATKFFEYIEKYKQDNNGKYPKYSSSDFEYYTDVYMNLLVCQEGLCAYTEQYIYRYYDEFGQNKYWDNGRFIGTKLKIDADIEHYKPKVNCNQECDWEWENLYLVPLHINRNIKRDKPVYDFMRPDNADYSPEKYLVYNLNTNMFVPNPALDDDACAKVEETLETLGINSSDTVWSNRKSKMSEYLEMSETKEFEILKKEVKEFHTAFSLSKDVFTNYRKVEVLTKVDVN